MSLLADILEYGLILFAVIILAILGFSAFFSGFDFGILVLAGNLIAIMVAVVIGFVAYGFIYNKTK